jgi:hypothetical protein
MENKHCFGCSYYYWILAGCDFEKFNTGECPCSICLVKVMCRQSSECKIREDYFKQSIKENDIKLKKDCIRGTVKQYGK